MLWNERDRLESFARIQPGAHAAGAARPRRSSFSAGVLAIYAFLAIGDAVYQRMAWLKRQRMSKQELKEEYKNTEGNPEIKAKLKQMRAARAKRRMMAAVPTATVVITNPTHYAVALKYERGMAAPICVAKGVDAVALKIRAVATEHRVVDRRESAARQGLACDRARSIKRFRWSTTRRWRKSSARSCGSGAGRHNR